MMSFPENGSFQGIIKAVRFVAVTQDRAMLLFRGSTGTMFYILCSSAFVVCTLLTSYFQDCIGSSSAQQISPDPLLDSTAVLFRPSHSTAMHVSREQCHSP